MTDPNIMVDYIRRARSGQTYEERLKEPYRLAGKLKKPTVCPKCRAIFHQGRWQWGEAPEGADEHLCPACLRERDRVPAGMLILSGEFFDARKQEIKNLIRNAEAQAREEHPLERIMAIEEQEGQTVITFTDVHITHGIGEALRHAYQGDLDSRYVDKDGLLRVVWKR